jgi:protein-tyrosine-phosphatase
MKKIIFVCVENSCRSQIAEAFAKIYSKDRLQVMSAGSKPSGSINPKAIKLMSELGYELTGHYSKSVETVSENVDYLITMGCGDSCPTLKALKRIEWDIPDPKDMNEREFKEVIGLIDQKVRELIRNIT